MTELTIQLDGDRTVFAPGEILRGRCVWQFDKPMKALEIRLFWYTQGKGTQDVCLVEKRAIATPALSGQGRFEMQIPEGPYSFSGTLITLSWALEALPVPGREAERLELVVSPTGREVILAEGAV